MTWRPYRSTHNVKSVVAFGLGGKDAQLVRREFLQRCADRRDGVESIPASVLYDLSPGEAYEKLAGGHAIKIVTPRPFKVHNRYRADEVVAESWERHRVATRPESPRSPRHRH
jgi:hypothetical protein